MNNFKKILTLTLVIPVLSGCNQKSSTSSNSDTGSSDISTDTGDTSSPTSSAIPPKSFREVLENNAYYNIYFESFEGEKLYHEINEPNIFAYAPRSYGYAIPENDSNFTHFFSINRDPNDYSLYIEMNGRTASANDFSTIKENTTTFISLLYDYSPLFKQDEENPWKFVAKSFTPSRDFKNYFQTNEFGYCDYYEVIVGENGRITNFNAGETMMASSEDEDATITEKLFLEVADANEIPLYQKWKEKEAKRREDLQKAEEEKITLPSARILFSPWCDVTMINNEISALEDKDIFLSQYGLREIGKIWAGAYDTKDYKISPKYGDLNDKIPTITFHGSDEILFPDSKATAEKLAANGARVRFVVGKGLFHIYPLFRTSPLILPESDKAFDMIYDFVVNKK